MGLFSFLGSAFGSVMNYKQNQDNMAFQRELQDRQFDFTRQENQKSRDFAKLSQEWANEQNIAQWNRSNDYNDPSRVRERLSKAGINPDLYYSGGAAPAAASNMPAQSHSPSANGSPSVSPVESKFDALEAQRLIAETENIKAQTRQVDEQTGVLSTYAEFQSALLQGQVDTANSSVRYNTELSKLPQAQIDNLRKQNDQLDKTMVKIDSEIQKLSSETKYTDSMKLSEDLRRYWYSSEAQAKIDNLVSQTDLSKAEAFELFSLLLSKKMNLDASTGMLDAHGKKLSEEALSEKVRRKGYSIQNGILSVDLSNLRNYNDLHQQLNNVNSVMNTFFNTVTLGAGGALSGFLK